MSKAFATVITISYIPFAKTLFQSLRKFDSDIEAFALLVDSEYKFDFPEFQCLQLADLSEVKLVKEIKKKYYNNPNALRWSLKSVLMIHLLKTAKCEQVFFVDPDLYFVNDFKFLYQDLGDRSFLLSPNWGCLDPEKSIPYFQNSQTDGLYNAGFLGATSKGLDTLTWWAEMCLYSCEKNKAIGLNDDQGYLNHFPIRNPDTRVITHRGCNIGEWNRFENVRKLKDQGKILINDIYPMIFIHFSNISSLIEFDTFLIPYLKEYELELKKNGFSKNFYDYASRSINRRKLSNLNVAERFLRKLIGHSNFLKLKGWNID